MTLPSNDQRTEEFLALLGQHEERLLGYIVSLVPNWADADDIAQEVRIRLWRQFDTFDRTKDFRAWACTVAHYLVLAHRKKQSRSAGIIAINSELVELIAQEMTDMADELDGMEQALKGCFEKLPESKRKLLIACYSGVHSLREVAAELGQSYDATRQALVRVRLALKACADESLRKERSS
jgi:RNA polymerase sigma-70 factor (ECF subfamily)